MVILNEFGGPSGIERMAYRMVNRQYEVLKLLVIL